MPGHIFGIVVVFEVVEKLVAIIFSSPMSYFYSIDRFRENRLAIGAAKPSFFDNESNVFVFKLLVSNRDISEIMNRV